MEELKYSDLDGKRWEDITTTFLFKINEIVEKINQLEKLLKEEDDSGNQ